METVFHSVANAMTTSTTQATTTTTSPSTTLDLSQQTAAKTEDFDLTPKEHATATHPSYDRPSEESTFLVVLWMRWERFFWRLAE